MKHLVVTADDFGLAEEINSAVQLAHESGILSAASLMVGAPAAADALWRARLLPRLRVGLHLVLVDGVPVLPPERIPGLVNAAGHLRSDMTRLAFDLACRPALLEQLRGEITAQFAAYRRAGLPLDHVDVHKHFHLHPVVAREVVRIGLGFGMRALRVPTEPYRVLRQIEGRLNGASSAFTNAWARVLRGRVQRSRLLCPDAVFGLQWSGAMIRDRMIKLLDHLPDGLIEVYTHPALTDTFHGHVPGYNYAEELEALCGPETLVALQRSGFRLGGYRDALDDLSADDLSAADLSTDCFSANEISASPPSTSQVRL